MKRVLSLLLGLLLTATAFASAETTAASDITGSIENGAYTLLIHAAPGDTGWFVETTEEMEAMLNVAEAAYTDEGFFVRLEPVSDGTVTVRILHQDDSEICDQVCTFELLIKDGATAVDLRLSTVTLALSLVVFRSQGQRLECLI